MKRNITLIILAAMAIFGCGKETDGNQIMPRCIDHATKATEDERIGYWTIKMNGKTATIEQTGLEFNCACETEGVTITSRIEGDTIIITETGNTNSANCTCDMKLEFNLKGIERKSYLVKIQRNNIDCAIPFDVDFSDIGEGGTKVIFERP